MQANSTKERVLPQSPAISVKNGICVLSGFGIKVSVDGQHLVCSDGIADERREIRLSRATSGLKQLVIIGHTGIITLDALRWLNKIGAGISAIDTDSNVVMASSSSGADYPHLRRSQALARDSAIGIDITKYLIRAKIEAQATVSQLFNESSIEKISSYIGVLEEADNYDQIRLIEGQAASIYWRCWTDTRLSYARQDIKRVPEYWLKFGTRSSPITDSPRKAANPANALLNYLYAVLETETVIACHTVGLDPGIGFLHHDQPSRNNLALDIMEVVRPQVDYWLHQFLAKQVFKKQDFSEDENSGCVRIGYDIRTMLAETAPVWAKAIAPWVEYVSQTLNTSKKNLPTKLTQQNRSQGRNGIRKKATQPQIIKATSTHVCISCGEPVLDKERKHCDKCLPSRQEENTALLLSSGVEALKQARQNGCDPAHGGEAARKRGETQRQRIEKRKQYEKEHGNLEEERARFLSNIQPKIKNIPLPAIIKATGLSLRYASLIKNGKHVPHPVYYAKLEAIIRKIPE